MPLKDRNLDEAIKVTNSNVINSTHGEPPSKDKYRFLVCGGAPGIGMISFVMFPDTLLVPYLIMTVSGKTRCGEAIYEALREKWTPPTIWTTNHQPHFEYLRLDFSNRERLEDIDRQLPSSIVLGIRIAYFFFAMKSRRSLIGFYVFLSKAVKYKERFHIDFILDEIRRSLHLYPNQHLFLYLHIDEHQHIPDHPWEGARNLGRGFEMS